MCQNNQQPLTIVLAYDLDTSHDSNINAEIKGYLKEKGWQDVTIDDTHPNVTGYYTKYNRQLPETTLINYNSTIEQAEVDFNGALMSYNNNHLDNQPLKKMAHYTHAAIFVISDYKVLIPH